MTPNLLLSLVIHPTLTWMGARYMGRNAERLLVAIALQESALRYRAQVGGPARSWWQFERGGVRGVLVHKTSVDMAREVCASLGYQPADSIVQPAMEHNDILACAMARLLLWTDAHALPDTPADGWAYYQRNWRPGKPHPEKWGDHWRTASEAVGG